MLVLAGAVSLDHIPGTDISLTVPYASEGPGPIFDTLASIDGEPVVEIQGVDVDETSGTLTMTTVSVRSNMTMAQALSRWLFTDDTLVPIEQVFPSDQTEEETRESNQLAFSSSEANATVAALNYLGLPLQVEVAGVVEGSAADGELEEGDIIRAIDGQEVTLPSEVSEFVQEKSPGDGLAVTVERDGAEQQVAVTLGESSDDASQAFLGILMTAGSSDGITVEYHLNDVGGPSAGMIFSLAVIDKLSPDNITGGKAVAGTGTISEDGTVGAIGGVEHKVRAAAEGGAEVFLTPAENCAAADSAERGEMTLISVDSLEDAVYELAAYSEGGDVHLCGE